MTAAQDDVLARLTGLHELHLGVAADHQLGCIQIDVQGLPHGYSAILAPNAALDLAWRLIGACTRLRRNEIADPGDNVIYPTRYDPGVGPFSARY